MTELHPLSPSMPQPLLLIRQHDGGLYLEKAAAMPLVLSREGLEVRVRMMVIRLIHERSF
jgi:hypothetical protein